MSDYDYLKRERAKTQAIRMEHAVKKLEDAGHIIDILDTSSLTIEHKGQLVTFFPFTGWHTGRTIKDGRGLNKLLEKLAHE